MFLFSSDNQVLIPSLLFLDVWEFTLHSISPLDLDVEETYSCLGLGTRL